MYNILTLNSLQNILEKNFSSDYKLSPDCIDPHAILVRSDKILEPQKYKNLLAIARAGTGVNNINIKKCSELGIPVFNTPGANSNAVKELVILSFLLASRNIIDSINWVKALKDKENLNLLIEKEKKQFKGCEIQNKKLGIIGLGSIGTLVANAACSLNMKVFAFDPFISLKSAWNVCRLVKKLDSLEDLFSSCDYISIHVPLNSKTQNMIDKKLLSIAKDNAKIFNFSRSEVVNSNDIIEAIKFKKISNYVTDFPHPDFLKFNQIISIPHLGASTFESENNCASAAAQQISQYLEFGNIKNSINFPDTNLIKTTSSRICILSKNIPNVISNVLNIISSLNLNIENMQSNSKKDFAYSIIDINNFLDQKTLDLLSNCEGIIKVRLI